MGSKARIKELEQDLAVWDALLADVDPRLRDRIEQHTNGIEWPDEDGNDELPGIIAELDETLRNLAGKRLAAKARLDRAVAGETV